jgi:ThiF family
VSQSDWYRRRNDRQLRYAGRVLPVDRPIAISLDANYAATYDGQVSALVGANLLARMTSALVLDIPDVAVVDTLPWRGAGLLETMLSVVQRADPHGNFETRRAKDGDYSLRFGRGPSPATVHGSGWYAFVGPGKSEIPDSDVPNPVGPSFAAVAAAGRLFGLEMRPLDGPFFFNTFRWSGRPDHEPPPFPADIDLGEIWTIGAGSVGTAALYFLTLATRGFSAVTVDMDIVKVENLDRSPIFNALDAQHGRHKSEVATSYLRSVGVTHAEFELDPLDKSARWLSRSAGTPDLVISAANERNVRYVIEQSCPPLQIYGTTGANWVASVIRHIPLIDACSCCVFPPGPEQLPLACAEGKVAVTQSQSEVDAALPFLSFGAGLMVAAEALKTALPGFPFTPHRTVFATEPSIAPRFTSLTSHARAHCVCGDRDEGIHLRMIAGSRYASLSSP